MLQHIFYTRDIRLDILYITICIEFFLFYFYVLFSLFNYTLFYFFIYYYNVFIFVFFPLGGGVKNIFSRFSCICILLLL